MTNTVYATFIDPDFATKATGALLDHGVQSEHISIVFPEGYVAKENGHAETENEAEHSAESGITTTTAADAGSGAAKGAGIGLAAGALAALAAVFIPGVGLVLGGGTLAIALGGAAATTAAGAIAGGVTGYLKDQGVPEDHLESYGRILGGGGALVSVFTNEEKVDTVTIENVLRKYEGSVSMHIVNASYLNV